MKNEYEYGAEFASYLAEQYGLVLKQKDLTAAIPWDALDEMAERGIDAPSTKLFWQGYNTQARS